MATAAPKTNGRHRRYAYDQREPHEDTNRWLVSYADFITLLFAFFVVMYSISQVNEGKYKVVSDALIEVFRDKKLVDKDATGAANDDAGTPPEPGIIRGDSSSENVIETEAKAALKNPETPSALRPKSDADKPAEEDDKGKGERFDASA